MHNIGDSGFKSFSDIAESLGLFNLKVSNSEFLMLWNNNNKWIFTRKEKTFEMETNVSECACFTFPSFADLAACIIQDED